MFENAFYHETIKKTIIAFGALFSNIQVIRRNGSNVVDVIKVPIAYGPKEKFIARLDADPELNDGVFITLPRLSFEIQAYNFNAAEMTNSNNKISCAKPDGTTFIYTPVPYDLNVQLYALTKGTEDGLAITEQILPLFQPKYTVTINALPEMNLMLDFPIILNNVSVQDDYEGDFSTRRLVTHVFDFTIKIKLLGPVRGNGVIYRTETTLPSPMNEKHVSQVDPNTGNLTMDDWSLN